MALTVKTAREARRYATQPAKKPRPGSTIAVEATEREKAGTAQGEVSHRLTASLGDFFDHPPKVGSPALCTWDGSRWNCVVYAEVGDRRFSLRDEDFRIFFQEVESKQTE